MVLLVEAGHDRERVMNWCAAIRQRLGERRLGLWMTPDTRLFHFLMPALRARTGARRFALIGPDCHLTDAGWRLLGDAATWTGDGLIGLTVEWLEMGRRVQSEDAQAFVWDSADFEPWHRRQPYLCGGFHGRNGLPPSTGPAPTGAVHVRRLKGQPNVGMAARINAALLSRANAPKSRGAT